MAVAAKPRTRTRKLRRRIPKDQRGDARANVEKLYRAGNSIRQIAESISSSYGCVHRLLTEAGVELRGRGGNTRRTG